MSSTLRGYSRHKSDYYITPVEEIKKFLEAFKVAENIDLNGLNVLDPCAGGDTKNPMSYSEAFNGLTKVNLITNDIRTDSRAEFSFDYLNMTDTEAGDMMIYFEDFQPHIIITNPPFNLALEIIKQALFDVLDGGYVIMLLRLNFFGSKSRKQFFENNMPKYCFIHHKRMSFTPNNQTDSIEYAHFVWQKGYDKDYSKAYLI